MAKEVKTPWQRFIGMLELDRKDIKQIFYYAIFAGLVALTLPLGIQAIINLIQGAQISSSWIILVVLVTLGVAFQGILQLMQARILENMQQKIFTRASFEFAYRFPKIKLTELNDYYPPELANRFFDILTVQKGLSKILIDFPAAILQIIFGLVLLSFYNPYFILFGLVLVTFIYLVFKYSAEKGMKTSLYESKKKYKVANWIQELARSVLTFKISSKNNLILKRNDELTLDYINAREGHFKIVMMQFVQFVIFKVLITSGLLLIGGLLVLNQQINIGQFVAAEIIILLVISSVEKIISGLESFYDVLTSIEKIGQVVDKEMDVEEGVNPFETKKPLVIELDDVGYTRPSGKEIVKSASLTIKSTDRFILQGPPGSGKSTLMKVISGLLPITKGAIYINDISIKASCLTEYRDSIGQVLPAQKPFHGTIKENITFGDPNVTQEEIHWALKNVGLLNYVKELPNGLNTVIKSEGLDVPHTISKRILLAAAIIHKPKLLMLKDALEEFDADEANKLIDFLIAPDKPWALFVSSRSARWNKKCNKKLFLNNGVLTQKPIQDA